MSNTEEGINGKLRNKKGIGHIENKYQNGRSKSLSVLITINRLNSPIKRYRWVNGLEIMNQLHAVCKRFTLDLDIQIDWK